MVVLAGNDVDVSHWSVTSEARSAQLVQHYRDSDINNINV
jgi:hypothetical protein